MHRFANPKRFLDLSRRIVPWLAGATIVLLAAGLVWGLGVAPPDYQQGDSARIMYVHVPAAWIGMFGYTFMAVASAVFLVWKHPLADLAARAAAPAGAGFTFVCLVTGSLWGKPMWGAWWVWDARLTSMLILLFLYLGYMALINAFDDVNRGSKAGAVLALVGIVNIPVIKFSVEWWNTLHQSASVSRMAAPAMPLGMLAPLLLMAVGFTTFFGVIVLLRMRSDIAAAKIRTLQLGQARTAPGDTRGTENTGEAAP